MGKSIGEKIYGVAAENDTLTIAYMMGAESANDRIRALKKRIAELEQQIEVMGIEQEQVLVANERSDLLRAFRDAFSEYWDARLLVASEGPYGKHLIKTTTMLCEKGRELEIKLVALFGKEKAKRIAFELNMRHLTDNEIEMISNLGI